MDTPSLVIVGAPHFFSSTTLRPLGPSVTLTASASWFMPRSRPRRASSSNAINLAIGCGPHFSYGHAVGIGAESGPAAAPATDGPLAPRVGRVGLTAYRLALTLDECQFRFSTHPRRVQEIRAGRTGRTARIDRFGGGVKDRSGPGPESGAAARARELSGVDDLDAVGLGTLRTLDDLELHPLVLVEGPVALGLDRRVVDEHVLAVVHGDKAVALLVVEPLHGALCHVHSLLCSQWGLSRCLTPRGARGLRSSAPLHCRARSCCGISGPWYLACRNSSLDRGGRYTERPAFSRRGFRPAKGPSALAVEIRHLLRRVPLTRHRTGRNGRVDGREIVRVKGHGHRGERLVEAAALAHPDQRHDVLAAGGDPRDGELRDGQAVPLGDRPQAFHQTAVAVEVLALEARAVAAPVPRVGGRAGAGEQPAGEHAVGGDG